MNSPTVWRCHSRSPCAKGMADGIRQRHEVRWLEIPVQRLFEPEDVERRDVAGEPDTRLDVIGRVHVQHQLDVRTDRFPNRARARDFVGQRQGAGLQFDRPETLADVAGQLLRAGQRGTSFDIESADRVGEHIGARAAQQPEDRLAGGLAGDVPQRDVDPRQCGHELRALVARQRRRQAVPSADASRARMGDGKQLLPDVARWRADPCP